MSLPEQNLQQTWAEVTGQLRRELRPETYDRWIGMIRPVSLQSGLLQLGVPNNFYQTWLEENYLRFIVDGLARAGIPDVRIQFLVVDSPADPSAGPNPLPVAATPSTLRGSAAEPSMPLPSARLDRHRPSSTVASLNQNYTFDTFVVGDSNHFCHAACLAVSQSLGRAYNPLFIYGGVGLGKTHLMQAIGHHVSRVDHRRKVVYVSSEQFTNEFIDAIQNRTTPNFRRRYRHVDLLLIDDIHFLAGKERLQEEFFHTFNTLFDAHKQIVLSSDRPATEISNLEQRLVSRFESGLVTELEPPDLETRTAILRKKASAMNLSLPPEVVDLISEKISSNVRKLEGALIRLASHISFNDARITLDVVRRLLRDLLEEEARNTVTIPKIQRAVAQFFDIRLSDLLGPRRPKTIAYPRQIAMYLSRELTPSSLPEIGQGFGGRDHGTVLHAHRKIKSKAESDPQLRQVIRSIHTILKTLS